MAKHPKYNWIPTYLTEKQFNSFILPHLSRGTRGPQKKLPFYRIFNYIMRVLSTGMKWEDLEIAKAPDGEPELHHTNIFKAFQGWVSAKCFEGIFESSVLRLIKYRLLDCSVLHGDGTNHSAKKGGDNIGYNGHKKIKGDKVVALCDRNVNVIAPFVSAPGNKNECTLLMTCLEKLKQMSDAVGLSLYKTVISLDGIYNSKANRKAIFNRKMVPNINLRACDKKRSGRKQNFDKAIYQERFRTIERLFAWEDKFKRVVSRLERDSNHFYAFKTLAYTLINTIP